MANSVYRYTDSNKSLPYITTQRPFSASNRFDEVRKSSSFDPLDRPPRQESPYFKQAFSEQSQLLDELRTCREEIAKKDRLLGQSSGSLSQPYTFDTSLKQPRPPSYINARNDTSVSQIRDLQLQLEQRDDRIWKLQLALDASKEAEAQLATNVQQLKRQLLFYETSSVKEVVSNSNVVISNLQQELREQQQRIAELESRLRTHMEERERAEQNFTSMERKFYDLTSAMTGLLLCDGLSGDAGGKVPLAPEEIVRKFDEIMQENSMMKGRHATLKDHIANMETEQKNNRETIIRITSEAERNQQVVSKSYINVENMKVERDAALSRQEELIKELDTMRSRLESSHKAWSQMKNELDEARITFSSVEAERQRKMIVDTTDGQRFSRFRENLAGMLSDGTIHVEPYEEQIIARINHLCSVINEKNAIQGSLEKKLSDTARELERQFELTKTERNKHKQTQSHLEELEEELRRKDNRESVSHVINNSGYHGNRDGFGRLLQRIASCLKMSPFKEGVSYEISTNEIIACIDDLIKFKYSNGDVIDDVTDDEAKRAHIVSLQKKVKSLKEQLNYKESQLERMNEKMKDFEEKLVNLEGRDEEAARERKLSKILEKYKLELNEAHLEIRQLRTRIVEAADLKTEVVEREEDFRKLKTKLKLLEQENSRLQQEVAKLRQEQQQKIPQLANELKSTKSALEEITRQHKQLFELRQLLAGMLGIHYNTSVAVDFEMISRLEKLIVASYRDPGLMESFAIDPNNSLGLADEFRRGYEAVVSGESLGSRGKPHKTVRINSGYVKAPKSSRSRSLSPQKKVDTKVY